VALIGQREAAGEDQAKIQRKQERAEQRTVRDWLSGSFPLKHYILNEDYVVIGDIGKGDRVAGISG
jgi:hypothetical protein